MAYTYKKWFTMIEMLMVIIIVGLLMLALASQFRSDRQNKLKAESCLNMIFGSINSFLFDAMTSKGITVNGQIIIPSSYRVVSNPTAKNIKLDYLSGWVWSNYHTLWLTWSEMRPECGSFRYHINLTWSRQELIIGSGDTKAFFLWPNRFTWSMIFQLIEWETKRSDMVQFYFDTRVYNFRRIRCLWQGIPCPRWLD